MINLSNLRVFLPLSALASCCQPTVIPANILYGRQTANRFDVLYLKDVLFCIDCCYFSKHCPHIILNLSTLCELSVIVEVVFHSENSHSLQTLFILDISLSRLEGVVHQQVSSLRNRLSVLMLASDYCVTVIILSLLLNILKQCHDSVARLDI